MDGQIWLVFSDPVTCEKVYLILMQMNGHQESITCIPFLPTTLLPAQLVEHHTSYVSVWVQSPLES